MSLLLVVVSGTSDGLTPGALEQLLLPARDLLALEAGPAICQWLDVKLRHLFIRI